MLFAYYLVLLIFGGLECVAYVAHFVFLTLFIWPGLKG